MWFPLRVPVTSFHGRGLPAPWIDQSAVCRMRWKSLQAVRLLTSERPWQEFPSSSSMVHLARESVCLSRGLALHSEQLMVVHARQEARSVEGAKAAAALRRSSVRVGEGAPSAEVPVRGRKRNTDDRGQEAPTLKLAMRECRRSERRRFDVRLLWRLVAKVQFPDASRGA